MSPSPPAAEIGRHLQYLRDPSLWPAWPFLPVVRRCRGEAELGVLFDAVAVAGLTGFSATVFRTNLFTLPPTVDGLLELPREMFDTADEVIEAGWRID